jgi:hypothetical protein
MSRAWLCSNGGAIARYLSVVHFRGLRISVNISDLFDRADDDCYTTKHPGHDSIISSICQVSRRHVTLVRGRDTIEQNQFLFFSDSLVS